MNRISILSTPVDVVTRKEALERCRGFLHSRDPHHIVTVNPEFIVEAQKNRAFRDVLQKSDLALADGTGVVLAARLLGYAVPERITGVDFLADLCGLAEHERAGVFFLGGRHGVGERTARAMLRRFPKLHISGWSESLWRASELINATKPAILFVALGASRQELWIAEHIKKLPSVRIAMGVGGAFDYIGGHARRAPRTARNFGLEWLWRLLREPYRAGRIAKATVVFPWLVFTKRKNRGEHPGSYGSPKR